MNIFKRIGKVIEKAAPTLAKTVANGYAPAVDLLINAFEGKKAPSEILDFLEKNPSEVSKLKEIEMAHEQELSLAELEIDKEIVKGNFSVLTEQAKSGDKFVSWARPALMWACVASVLYGFIFVPTIAMIAGAPVVPYTFPAWFPDMITSLFGIYGLARTADKGIEVFKNKSK